MKLCSNCLGNHNQRDYPVGHERGHQRDPYHVKVSLCGSCKKALEEGDFATLNTRYRAERTIKRSTAMPLSYDGSGPPPYWR